MSDYGKKKNDELAALCKERGLAHTGKKADLVKRLEEHDAKASSTTAETAAKPAANEDEIDWDEEPATSAPAANAVAAGGVGQVPNPQAVPNQEAAIDPAQTNDLSVDPPADETAPTEEQKVEKDFSSGIADRTIDEEIEKLKLRCEKFGMDPNENEAIKKLERAKKFGTTALAVNHALPEKKESGKRHRAAGDSGDGGIRKQSRGPRGRGRPGPDSKRSNEKPKAESGSGGFPKWMTDKDREAAERRKAKFAA